MKTFTLDTKQIAGVLTRHLLNENMPYGTWNSSYIIRAKDGEFRFILVVGDNGESVKETGKVKDALL